MKFFKYLSLLGITVLLTACSSHIGVQKKDLEINKCYTVDGTIAPKWVCTHNLNGIKKYKNYIIGVGIGSNVGEPNLQYQIALSEAKNEISGKIRTKIKNMFRSYLNSTGNGNKKTLDKDINYISKQTSKTTLYGTEVISTWNDTKNKKLYVIAGVPKKNIDKYMKSTIETSFKNDKALWQEYKAFKAWKKLDNGK